MRNLALLAVAIAAPLALASCSAEQQVSGNSALIGGETFLELVEDARIAVRAGNLAEAGRYYDEARSLEPENPGLWVDIARLRFRGGEHLTAIEAADFALQLDPQYAPAILMRAQLVRDAHGLAESLVWFEAAAAADPRNPEVLAEYAATLGDLGRYEDMLAVIRELAEFAPGLSQVHFQQAVLAARAEDPVLASTLLTRSGLSGQGVASAMMLDAIVNMQQGNFDTSVEVLEALAERQPGNMRVSELLARALWLGGRDREIVARFAERAQAAQASPYLIMLVGRAYERRGDRARALPLIERAQESRQASLFALDTGGSLPVATAEMRRFVASGNDAAAQRLANSLTDRLPLSGDVHVLAGDAELDSGNAERALELYQVAAQVRRSWPLTRKIIAAYRAYGDEVAAEVVLTRYIAGDPHNTEALLLLARNSAQQEDWLRALVVLDTAIALGAGNDLEVLGMRADAARVLGRTEEATRFDAARAELKPDAFVTN
ncbi:tetratricopeptide repeat protein [uncultured Erythrobacter sp.]|uniref:tetratricopeptide repeat protein n=1 Tax=uncultured Erythrobacter sp. TaxID=263913 RepID=UPI0026327D9D|nr:tetratricopeptide repeat protein [uncultured Erythrobacter sp.]